MIPQIEGGINVRVAAPDLGCADPVENALLNEMGRQGWGMVNLGRLEETVPGSEWCRGVTVGYRQEQQVSGAGSSCAVYPSSLSREKDNSRARW